MAWASVPDLRSGSARGGAGEPYIAQEVFWNRPYIAAFSGGTTAQTNVPAGYAAVVVNDQGAFFNKRAPGGGAFRVGGRYGGGTPVAQAFVLLHEMGHGLLPKEEFRPDYGNPGAGRWNDRLVLENCEKTLREFQ